MEAASGKDQRTGHHTVNKTRRDVLGKEWDTAQCLRTCAHTHTITNWKTNEFIDYRSLWLIPQMKCHICLKHFPFSICHVLSSKELEMHARLLMSRPLGTVK